MTDRTPEQILADLDRLSLSYDVFTPEARAQQEQLRAELQAAAAQKRLEKAGSQ